MYIQTVLLDVIIVFWRMIFTIHTTQSDKSYHHAKSSGTILAISDQEASIQGFILFQSWRYKTKTVIECHKTP